MLWLISGTSLAYAQGVLRATGLTSGDCQTTAQKFVVASKPVIAQPNSVFSTLPERISFLQGKPGCVVVSFTAETNLSSATIVLTPLLDDQATALPSTIGFATGNGGHSAHGMNFIFPSVAVGRHVLRFEFASNSPASTFHNRSTILSYIK